MGRKQRVIPSLYLHRASGQWCCNLGGRRRYLGKDLARAEAEHRLLCAGVLTGTPPQGGAALSVNEVLLAYRRDAESRFSPAHFARVEAAIAACSDACGSLPVDRIDQLQIEAIRRRLVARRTPDGLPYSRNYVNHLIRALKSAFIWAAARALCRPETALAVRSVTALRRHEGGRETPRVLPVPRTVIDLTLPELHEPVATMVRLQLLCGMRPGEVCRMRRGELSTSAEEVLYPENGPPVAALELAGAAVWLYAPGDHKTSGRGKLRLVPLGPKAQALLRPFLEGCRPEALVFRGGGPRGGKGYTTQSYGQAIARACRKLGIARWGPGRLRHNAASLAVDVDGYDAAAALLGHASPDMTSHYAEQAIRRAAELMAKFG